MKYTDYCTCFMVEDDKVYFWDEIMNRKIEIVKVKSKEEASALMNKWKKEAPANVICHIL